uniref:Uncharacterized protein n=1 Tax=Arundo donax TaxID=35708 RepID=A0A0A9AS42_ARUDO
MREIKCPSVALEIAPSQATPYILKWRELRFKM